ncbi:MAG: c-type cytochrome biogenesis protein CcmI [Rhizobiaceae bacterium]|nr:c-type cytochrome biogenesis protein CcmI [Rhizobiaceae bacterium]
MMFWIIVLGLTILTVAVLMRPLLRDQQDGSDILAYDREVYKDQLSEIDRDFENGLLTENEAELARIEISRRLIAADAKNEGAAKGVAMSYAHVIPIALMIPAIAIGIYTFVGQPAAPDMPLALRTPPPETQVASRAVPEDIAQMVAQAEAHLVQNPNDGRGWDVLAPIYFRMGEFLKAQQAYAKAIELEGSTALRHASLGEAIVTTQEGAVTPEARSNFLRALELDPNAARPKFFLALGLGQNGQKDAAIDAFEALARTSPADAPWIRAVQVQIANLKGVEADSITLETLPASTTAQSESQPSQLGNPTQEDIAAASEMEAGDRMAMIKNMVASLDEKLIDEPDNFEGWQRLLQSYIVLGEPDSAAKALERALKAFSSDTDQGRALLAQAKSLGIATPNAAPKAETE